MRARSLALALVLVAAPAAAQNANPPPYLTGTEPRLFPRFQDRWLWEVRAPGPAGRQRFSRIDAKPNRRLGWDVAVTCGLVSMHNGREEILVHGHGDATRGRQQFIGGTWTPSADGSATQNLMIDQSPRDIGRLDLKGTLTDRRCASGRGDISSGD